MTYESFEASGPERVNADSAFTQRERKRKNNYTQASHEQVRGRKQTNYRELAASTATAPAPTQATIFATPCTGLGRC